jgi:hypothetical protein
MSTGVFYDRLQQILPGWMQVAPWQTMGNVMAGFAALLDALNEGILEGRLAAMPGQVRINGVDGLGGFDSIDALPLIGRDRGIRQGIAEAPWDYAFRLRSWLAAWTDAGTPYQLLLQLAGALGPDFGTLRLVYKAAAIGGKTTWWSWDGTTLSYQTSVGTDGWSYVPATGAMAPLTTAAHAWDWDSETDPPPYDWLDGSRFWVICYAPLTTPAVPLPGPTYESRNDLTFNDAGVVNDEWLTPTSPGYVSTSVPTTSSSSLLIGTVPDPLAGTIGLNAPQMWVESIRHVLNDFQSAACRCAYIIVSFDPDAFNPTSDSIPTSVPDGTWGWESAFDPTSHARLVCRFVDAEYIAAAPGGRRN